MEFDKYDETEEIEVGDIVSLCEDKVRLAQNHFKEKDNKVIGVCTKTRSKSILVANRGIYDVNIISMVGIGDKLTTSDTPGKAQAIRYTQDETQFDIRSIGKVIGLYNDYSVAKVLLDIE